MSLMRIPSAPIPDRTPRTDRRARAERCTRSTPGTRSRARARPGARAEAPAYAAVKPDRALEFPADHGSHPDFRTEWWYVTGWLATEAGETARLSGHLLPHPARRR